MDKSWYDCQESHKQTMPHNYHPLAEVLVLFHAGSPALSPESMSSQYLVLAVSVDFPNMVLTPLAHMILHPSLWTPGAQHSV